MPQQYQVGDTAYEFPDNFTDDQVTGILSKQGIIPAPKHPSDLGTGALQKPFLPPSPMASVPRPPIGPEDLTPPPSAEAMQGVLGPLAPTPTATPFNLPVTPIRKSFQSQGPIGPLPSVTNPIDVAPPPSAKAPMVNTPLAVTPQFNTPPIPGYGPVPGIPKPPVPPGLQPQSVPPESINPELTTGTGVSPEQIATSGVPKQQQTAYEGFMKRWAIPAFKPPAPVDPSAPPSAEGLTAAQSMEGAGGLDNEQISNLAKTVSKLKGSEQELYAKIGDAALGLVSPESIATMLSAELGTAGIQALANSPKVVNIISKLPGAAKIRQAVDFAARNAVPGTFVGMAGKQAVDAAQKGDTVSVAVNALIAVAGALGIHADVKAVGEIHPTAPETPGGNAYADMPAGKRAAEATAEKLEAQGQGLAARNWRDVAESKATPNQPVSFKAGDQNLTLKPNGKWQGRENFLLVDDTGKTLTGGMFPDVQAWMSHNLPEVEIPGGESGSRLTVSPEGKLSSAPTPNVPAIGAPARPASGIFRDADALYQKGVDVAKNNPSFGTKKLRADTGASADEAEAILQRLQDEGVVKRTQNARGSVVYHAVPPSQPSPAPAPWSQVSPTSTTIPSPSAPIPPVSSQPPVASPPSMQDSDLDTILGGKETAPFQIGDDSYTVNQEKTKSGGSAYIVRNAEGEDVPQAGRRKASVETWIAGKRADAAFASSPLGSKPNEPPQAPTTPESAEPGNIAPPSPGAVLPGSPSNEEPKPEVQESLQAPPSAEVPTEEPRKFSSTQVNLPIKFYRGFRDATAAIPDSELAEDGRETVPHITVKYGLHDEEPAAVKRLIQGEGPITANIGKVSVFPANEGTEARGGGEYDVVKLDVDSPELHALNAKIATLPHTDTHPQYQPHITLAYVKPGEGAKYVGKDVPGLTGQTVTFPTVWFSGKDKAKGPVPISLQGARPAQTGEPQFTETAITPTRGGLVGKPVQQPIQQPPTEEPKTRKARGIIEQTKVTWRKEPDWYPDIPGPRPPWSEVVNAYANYSAAPNTGMRQHIKDFAADYVQDRGDAHWHRPSISKLTEPAPNISKLTEPAQADLQAPPSAETKPSPSPESPALTSHAKPLQKTGGGSEPKSQQSVLASVAARLAKEAEEAEKYLREIGFYTNANVGLDPRAIIPLATIGANYMAQGIVRGERWRAEMVKKFGEAIAPHLEAIREKAMEVFEGMLQEAAGPPDQAPPSAESTGTSEPINPGASESNVGKEPSDEQETPQLEVRGQPERHGGSDAEALAGVSPEHVPGAGQEGTPVQGDRSGDGQDSGSPGEPAPRGDELRPGKRNRVPRVVPPAGRKGSAQPDLRTSDAPTGTLDRDFSLTPEQAAEVNNGGARTKARNNLEAIRTIKAIQKENGRNATLEEQQKISRYVGWGDGELAQGIFKGKREWAGITEELKELLTPAEFQAARESTINAHYTRLDLTRAMWDVARQFGFRAGASVIEPGMGIGNFFITMPEDLKTGTRRTGVEMDLMTGSMARALYPGSNVVVKPYQDTTLPDGYFDFAIGNVPFANISTYDPAYKRFPYVTNAVHNYFFAKTLDKLRPGGVMFMITSRGTMDAPSSANFRRYMSERAELLGAIRLPKGTFRENAGTEVTVDVIALRKRIPTDEWTQKNDETSGLYQEPVSKETWIESKQQDIGEGFTTDTNEYFIRHPEMMIGEMKPGTQYHKGYPELEGEFSIPKFLELAGNMPSDVIPSWDQAARSNDALVENYPDANFIKQGQYSIVNGALVQRDKAYFRPTGYKGKVLERAKGLIGVRGAAREVVRSQDMDLSEEVMKAARKELNKVYDAFVKKHGFINANANARVFSEDPDWPLLSSLEDWNKKTKTATKRQIFTERTIHRPKRAESADTGTEALAITLNDTGRIDWDRMQSLTSKTPEELQQELAGKIYRNPVTKRWETQDEYLSGNVRKKLTDAEFAANEDPAFTHNVDALKAVQPKDLDAGEIDVLPGAVWIPEAVYSQFMNEVLKVEEPRVNFIPQTGSFGVRTDGLFTDKGVTAKTQFGNAYFDGVELFAMQMNGKSPVARDTYRDFDGNEKTVKNPRATIEANEKQRLLGDEFTKWFWKDPERATIMARKYNDEQNNIKLREFDGSHLTFPGLNRSWLRGGDPDKHQKDAVWRALQNGNTLLAHVVGSGKTLEMILIAMESKRLGLARKPMGVVPNHLVSQWRDDFLKAYPGAQLLIPTKKDFQKNNRKKMMARIATGNYDAVIVGHKGFELLPVKDETFNNFMQEQIAEVEAAIDVARAAAGKDHFRDPTTKQLVRRKKQLEEKLKKRTARDTKDDSLTFEELGVDMMFVDEAHCFPYEALVTTDRGLLPIGKIVEDRLPVLVLSRAKNGQYEWQPVVEWYSNRQSAPMVRVTHGTGSFECTANHQIWTAEDGYVEAGSLRSHHHLQVCPVQERVHLPFSRPSQQCEAEVLREPMRGDVEEYSTWKDRSVQSLDRQRLDEGPEIARVLGADALQQSDEQPRHPREDAPVVKGAYLPGEGRERKANRAAVGSFRSFESSYRTSDQDASCAASLQEPAEFLSRGFGAHTLPDSYRSGRENAQATALEVPRSSKDGGSDRSRVVSVAFHERTGDERSERRSFERQTVYCLEVANNHNFFASGVLVSNSFKNLGYMTMMDRIAGLPNSDAGRSVDMLLKTQYITQLHGGSRGLVFATGTPVSNSIAETWTMMRYLMMPYLQANGFDQFDAWAKTFGRTKTEMEVAPEGGKFISRKRFADFSNATELMNMFRLVADIKTKKQLNLPTPAIDKGGPQDAIAPASEALKEFVKGIGERADSIRKGEVKDPSIDNMLKISSDARKASLDMRLVDPTAKEDPNSKVNNAVKNILGIYKEFDSLKAAQLVFLDLSTPKSEKRKKQAAVIANTAIANVPDTEDDEDLFNEAADEEEEEAETTDEARERFTVYSEIKKKLVAGGIPENQVAFIHDANTDAKKAALFEDVNSGDVRVLIGSTEKMGAGMNVQKRLIALHHLDAPWRPSDVEQREGRIDRQGNWIWDEHKIPVRIFRYMTEGSFDSFMWQTILAKARPIARLMEGDPSVRRVEEPGPSVLSYEQAMAGSAGNPQVREKIILDQDINRMEIMRGSWLTEQTQIGQQLAGLPAQMASREKHNAALEDDIATRNENKTLVVGNKSYADEDIRKSGADALVAALKKLGDIEKSVPLDATYRGFQLQAVPDSNSIELRVAKGKQSTVFVVEQQPDKSLLYSKTEKSLQLYATYTRKELDLTPLSKAEAQIIHDRWYQTGIWVTSSTLRIATLPQARIMAKSGSYAVSVNYASPVGTISSADYHVKGFEDDLKHGNAEFGRLEKQSIELKSREGNAFKDEDKLRTMRKRQAELAELLGEKSDDQQAVAMAEDDEKNPLAPLLKDPASAMEAKWFPSRKYYVDGGAGSRESVRGNAITDQLAVREIKGAEKTRLWGKDHANMWSIEHMPTGHRITNHKNEIELVNFARRIGKLFDWDFQGDVTQAREAQVRAARKDWVPPTETPEQSVARLKPKPDIETPAKVAADLLSDTSGSLNIAALFHPAEWGRFKGPPAAPVKANARRRIKRLLRESDIPDTTLDRVLKNDYGIESLDKLDRNQFVDLAAKIAEKLPGGIRLREPFAKPWDKWIASPSVVLPRSRAGAAIWRAANRQYWRQKALADLFIRNYTKATNGLSMEDKQRVILYRYVKQILHADEGKTGRAEALLHAAGEDPDLVDSIDTDFLDAKQKAGNDKLTTMMFDPIWQRSVKEGLVPEDRYIDDYLTFYRDDLNQSPRSGDRRDRAALIAQETGMRLDVADKILAMANAKKVTFGPFDFRRGKFTLPGMLSLDEIANIYIRGFARKSAHTAFLAVANKARPKIKDPHLRDYARMYINQYVGVPQPAIFDNWINRKIHSSSLVKKLVGDRPVSAESLAMAATSIQYVAKIGLNAYTPLQNLTQATNTLAKAGVYRTAQGAYKYLAARTAPYARRAWAKELIRLRRSGVLDSMSNKIERPAISGLKGKALDALTFFFDQSEQFNRGTAFFAGYLKAKAAGLEEGKAIMAGRDLVRMTQFMSGRLDAPLMSRGPSGRVLYQFKVFSLKSFEMFWHHMDRVEKLKLMLWSVAVGGPTALGVSYLMHTFMPDSPYTEKLDEWQETANLAAFLQIPRLATAVGIWQAPLADQFSTFQSDYGRWWEQTAKWIAGPTINAIFDTANDALKLSAAAAGDKGDAEEKAWKFTFDLLRSWVPGGVELRRLAQAMKEGDTTEDQLKIIFAAYNRDNPGQLGKLQEMSRKLGIEKLIPDVLPENAEVK